MVEARLPSDPSRRWPASILRPSPRSVRRSAVEFSPSHHLRAYSPTGVVEAEKGAYGDVLKPTRRRLVVVSPPWDGDLP
jgi:hypothetical protein